MYRKHLCCAFVLELPIATVPCDHPPDARLVTVAPSPRGRSGASSARPAPRRGDRALQQAVAVSLLRFRSLRRSAAVAPAHLGRIRCARPRDLLLPPNLPASAVKAVPKYQTPAETFIAWLLSFLAQVLLVRQRRSSPPYPGLSLRRSLLTVSLQSRAYLNHGNAQPSRGRLAPPAPPCPAAKV